MGLSESVRNAILNHYFGKSTLTPPSNYYVGLALSNGNEPSGGGYARVSTSSSDWNSASGGEITNANAITFPSPSGDWGTMAKAKLFDAASGGNELGEDDLTEPVEVTVTTAAPEFAAGTFHVKLNA